MIHPILPAGLNSWEINGDEFNGAGVNEPIWPELFDTSIVMTPIVVTADMLAEFETECPDYVVAHQSDTVCIGAVVDTIAIERAA